MTIPRDLGNDVKHKSIGVFLILANAKKGGALLRHLNDDIGYCAIRSPEITDAMLGYELELVVFDQNGRHLDRFIPSEKSVGEASRTGRSSADKPLCNTNLPSGRRLIADRELRSVLLIQPTLLRVDSARRSL
jgi:hypothetical protein